MSCQEIAATNEYRDTHTHSPNLSLGVEMLRKLTSVVFAGALAVAMIGCDQAKESADTVADQAKETVDSATDTAKDAAEDVVPEAAQGTVDGAIDQGGDAAKDGIDKAADAVKGDTAE